MIPCSEFHEALAPPFAADIFRKTHSPGGGKGVLIRNTNDSPSSSINLRPSPVSCSDPRIIPEQFFHMGRNGKKFRCDLE